MNETRFKPTRHRIRFSLAILIVAGDSLVVGCERPAMPTPSPSPAAIEKVTAIEPDEHSYGFKLGDAPFSAEYLRLESPFPTGYRLGPSNLGLIYDGDDSTILPVYPDTGTVRVLGSEMFYFNGYTAARRNAVSYRIAGSVLSAAQDDSGDNPRLLWRYVDEYRFVAGPAVFDDYVIAASSQPALVAVDRLTGVMAFKRPIARQPQGPLIVLEEPRLMIAYHRDGVLGFYRLEATAPNPGADDPVETFIRPSEAVVIRIKERLAVLVNDTGFSGPSAYELYDPRRTVPPSGVILFRLDPERDGTVRIYLDGAGERPYLIALFDSSGEEIRSNLEYTAERVVEIGLMIDSPLFVAAGFLGPEAAAHDGDVRLIVAPK